MKNGFASNSVFAESKYLFGQRLSARNYDDLTACRDVGEIASYLKSRTAYSDFFTGISASAMHRGPLENLLKDSLETRSAKLIRYEMSVGKKFYRYFIMQSDIKHLLACVRLLSSGSGEKYIFTMNGFFSRHSELDLKSLAYVTTYRELLHTVRGTVYHDLLAEFEEGFPNPRSNLDIEARLYRLFYRTLREMAEQESRGGGREEILEVLRLQADMHFIVTAYRLIKMLGAGESYLRNFYYPELTHFTEKQADALLSSDGPDEFLRRLGESYYGKSFRRFPAQYIEGTADRILYEWHRKTITYSTNPTVVMLCYIYLAGNEVNNIIHIVEGVRYGFYPEKIQSMLIGAAD